MPFSQIDFRDENGDNIFHLLVEDHKLMKSFYQDYKKFIFSQEEKLEQMRLLESYLMILIPNKQGITPF